MIEKQEQRVILQNRWFAKRQEAAIEPELPICDAHHHLWEFPGKRYLAEEYVADIRNGHNIVSSVYVECGSSYWDEGPKSLRPVGEVEFSESERARVKGQSDICDAVVGFADLRLGSAVGNVLDAQISQSQRFVGIRYATAWDSEIQQAHTNPGERLMEDPVFLEGFAELAKRDLSFDVWIYHPQLPEIIALARRFPTTPIIIDHLGGILGIGPYANRKEVCKIWQNDIKQLAAYDNIYMKLGGACMPMSGHGWHKRDLPATSNELDEAYRPYFFNVIEHFGVERCMFESNFPVDRMSVSFNNLWNFYKKLTRKFSPAERAYLFHDTATRLYRINSSH